MTIEGRKIITLDNGHDGTLLNSAGALKTIGMDTWRTRHIYDRQNI